jgi:hypothetical protein
VYAGRIPGEDQLSENLRVTERLRDIDLNGTIILTWLLKK